MVELFIYFFNLLFSPLVPCQEKPGWRDAAFCLLRVEGKNIVSWPPCSARCVEEGMSFLLPERIGFELTV